MYIKVRTSGQEQKNHSFDVSRILGIADLKKMICNRLKIEPNVQRLFFAGKQMEDKYTLFDYSVNQNSVIQLMVRVPIAISPEIRSLPNSTEQPSGSSDTSSTNDEERSEESQYFKVGDYVDVRDSEIGSWFIGKLLKIKKNPQIVDSQDPNCPVQNDGLIYVVSFYQISGTTEVKLEEIRPLATEIIPFSEVKSGNKLLMNYNMEHPKERGYWYDVVVKAVKTSRRSNEVICDVTVGNSKAVLKNCRLIFIDDIFVLKPYTLTVNRTPEDDRMMQMEPVITRADPLYCIACKDKSEICCKECGCRICGGKDNEDCQIMCDECDHPYHMLCLDPPIEVIPEDEYWYCPNCKNDENSIVGAGQELRCVKITSSGSRRGWGNGMACNSLETKCTSVPTDHFGPVPGVEVGTTWVFRLQVSSSGIHRPPVTGIHGRNGRGAFSIVVSGGYEDDVDYGDEFLYTGSGGRDLKDNRRTAPQTFDQKLTLGNKALAMNCNAAFNKVNGAEAKNWRKGKPVRVVRSYNIKSEYAPEMGFRYDGIYKVVKYFPTRGKSGFIVWRYLLRRDDPAPAPWTRKGIKRMDQLQLKIILPENYEERKLSSKRKKGALTENFENNKPKSGSSKIKGNTKSVNKKIRIMYELEPELEDLIASDKINKKYWDDCKNSSVNGKKVFLEKVEETFQCGCCQDIVWNPITTKCKHNICKNCLKRTFAAKIFQCPMCRTDLDKNCTMEINKKLASTLLFLFPGYNTGR